ncbi:MAG TPA: ABC transporter permease, partial [Vicinamibacterales bacterium]
MTLRDLILRARALFRPNRVEQDLNDELAFHIERETQKLVDEGLAPREARRRAQARFGSTTVVADECRDERGIALIDNTIRDIQYAARTFTKAPLASFTIVATVAVGLGLVAMVFTVFNTLAFRADNVPDITEMYEVVRPGDNGGQLTRQDFDALQSETSVFTDSYATANSIDLRVDGRMMAVSLVTGNFFQILRVNPFMGRGLTPEDDARSGGNPVIVLSHKGWDRHFKRDPGVIGRRVLIHDAPYEIIGVTPEGFRGLEVSAPDFWAPLSQMLALQPQYRGREAEVDIDIVGRLKPGVSKGTAREQLAAWDANRSPSTAKQRQLNIDLVAARGTIPQPLEALA